jgi:O-antigen ligase
MEVIFFILLLSIGCFVLPIHYLILLSILGVALADTRLVSYEFIYYVRFVPIGIFCFRLLADVAKRPVKANSSSIVKIWGPFLGLALISTMYSSDLSLSAQRVLSAYLVLGGFGIGIPIYCGDEKKVMRLLWLISSIMGIGLLYCLYLAISDEQVSIDYGAYDRVYGIFKNPNTLGILSMQLIFILVHFWNRHKAKMGGKIWFGMAIGVGAAMVTSGSRAAILGFCIGLLVYILGNSRLKKSALPAVWAVILILVSIFLTVGFFFPEYSGSVFRTDSAGRITLWTKAWDIYKDGSPWGAGFGASDEIFVEEASVLGGVRIYTPESHNSFLRLLLDLGFPGVVLSLLAFVLLICRAWKYLLYFENPRLGILLLAAVIGSLVDSLFESWLFGFGSGASVPFWLFLSILSHLSDQAKTRLEYAKQYYKFSQFARLKPQEFSASKV